jgi:ferritin-like metal-binding protein YciE
MTFDSLHSLLIHELSDLHSGERQLMRALPGLARAAASPELKSALNDHLKQTREHARRLERVLAELGASANGQRSKAMAALIRAARDVMKTGGDPAVLDAGLITAAQKIEHYEISGYGSARTYANMLRLDAAADILQQTLNEEGAADEALTELAEATLSVTTEPGRLDRIAMHGDTEPGGADRRSYDAALAQQQDEGAGIGGEPPGDDQGAPGA